MMRQFGRAKRSCLAVLAVVAAAAMGQAACWADATRVRVKLDVRGELVAPTGRDGDAVRQPITVAGRFDFMESAADEEATGAKVERTFADATADITVDGQSTQVALPDDARRLLVARVGTAPVPYLPDAFLTRAELDLLDLPFDAVLVDAIRPEGVVAVGDSWRVPADIAAGLLAIDTIDTGTIDARLDEVGEDRGRVTLTGIVEGAVNGVPTHIVIEGSCTIVASPDISSDAEALRYRLDGSLTHLSATLQERRQASHVAPGFDVEARVVMSRVAQAATEAGDDADEAVPASTGSRRQGEGKPGLVWHRDSGGRFDLVHDARWRAVEEGNGTLVMRYVDRGALVAQCSITAIPPAPASSLPTIPEVHRDIRRSLAEQFERFEGATESTRSDGLTIVRVVSAGTAEKLPFRWIHYVLADASGRRASVAFMLEAPLAKRFGGADQALVDGLVLGDSPTAREARLPRKSVTP